jgi:hypothetical protein
LFEVYIITKRQDQGHISGEGRDLWPGEFFKEDYSHDSSTYSIN